MRVQKKQRGVVGYRKDRKGKARTKK